MVSASLLVALYTALGLFLLVRPPQGVRYWGAVFNTHKST